MGMTVADMIVRSLADLGVRTAWGVVGDALNPITDAIRRSQKDGGGRKGGRPGIEWIGVRHEEAGAFAASAQAQLTGTLGVCMGTVGPGGIHLLNGLYDAKKSHAPVLAIVGQVPSEEMGSDMFQEVDNDVLYADVAVYTRTLTNADHAPYVLEQAVNAARSRRGVAVLTIPGDVGDLELEDPRLPRFLEPSVGSVPAPTAVDEAVRLLDAADRPTIMVGVGARAGRDHVLRLAEKLQAPVVVTLKAKDGFDHDDRYQVGQAGLIGNPAAQRALDGGDLLLMLGTDFPYRDWYPEGVTVIQVDDEGSHIGRRTPVDLGLVGDAGATAAQLADRVRHKKGAVRTSPATKHLEECVTKYADWRAAQAKLADPGHDRRLLGRLRSKADNPDGDIRPEQLAETVGRLAAPDTIYTADTGMATVWLSRFVQLGAGNRLIGSFNLGSMANAMPQALGAQALDRSRQVVAFCGDGGLTMLLGDLLTAVSYDLPATFVVFDNRRLGMVKLEMEQVGLPEFGTRLDNPDLAAVARAMGLHAIRVEDPDDVEAAVAEALAHPGPSLLDVVTNADEVSVPPKPTVSQGWGYAIAKVKEGLESR